MEDYYSYHHKVVARKRRRRAVIAVLVVLALLCAAVGAYYFAAGGKAPQDLFAAQPVGAPASQPESSPATPEPGPADALAGYTPQRLLPAVDTAAWDTAAPVPATLDDGYYNTDYRMVAVPALGTVSDGYFNTVTFVGDSIASGLGLASYEALPDAHYATYNSAAASSFVNNTTMKNAVTKGKETPMEVIVASQPDYVYLHVGTNDLVTPGDEGVKRYLGYYERLIDMLREQLPGVVIYIQSIPGVQEDVVNSKPGLDNARIMTVNNLVANMALRKGCRFVNTQEALTYPDGSAIDEYSAGDGIHFNPIGYHAWADYLRTHTVWDRRSVYLGQNPYYIYGR